MTQQQGTHNRYLLFASCLFSQIQNGQTPWGCASDEILDLFKSAGVYVLILLDCGYETHGAMRIMLALILSDTDYMVYRMIVTA